MSSLLDILISFFEPRPSSSWMSKNAEMLLRVVGTAYAITLALVIWHKLRRPAPAPEKPRVKKEVDESEVISSEPYRKVKTSLDDESKRRTQLEEEVTKLKEQADSQKARFEKQVEDILGQRRAAAKAASDASYQAQEEAKAAAAKAQKELEAERAARTEAVAALKASLAEVEAKLAESQRALAELQTEMAAERIKVKKGQDDREKFEKELAKERERSVRLEGQCDRALKEVEELTQQLAKAQTRTANDSRLSETAPSETQANRTFLEDLEKSLQEVENEDHSSVIADLREQFNMPTDDAATSATAALEALERALEESNQAGSDEEQKDEEDEDARANAPDPNYKPPPPIPLPDPASLSSILRTDSKKDEKKASRKRVSFTATGVEGAEEGKDEEGGEKRASADGEAPVLFKDYSVKSDMNKAGQARARRQAPGLSGKLEMEDENLCAYPFVDEHHALFCVFDGHAGRDCAVDAKKHFPLEMASLLQDHLHDTNVAEVFKAAYARTDQKLLQHEYMGATATTAYLWAAGADRYLQCANVGDSTAFLCRNGVAEQLSVDHKASAPTEKDRIRALGIEISDSQNRIAGLAVSRALGDHFTKQEKTGITGEPTVSAPIKLLPTDTLFILASDGLWDVMSGQAAVDLVKNMPDAEQMCTTLITTALRLPKCRDNITVIVVRL